jgi:glyoxylase-like metal-dependent hydrolase (beta-lactamase superfamily II)
MVHRAMFSTGYVPEYVDAVLAAQADGRVRVLDGDADLGPGLAAVHLPGHTPGQQGLRVETAAGAVVLVSDAAHFPEELDHDWMFSHVDSVSSMYQSYDRLRALRTAGDTVIPGHSRGTQLSYPGRSFEGGGRIVDIS